MPPARVSPRKTRTKRTDFFVTRFLLLLLLLLPAACAASSGSKSVPKESSKPAVTENETVPDQPQITLLPPGDIRDDELAGKDILVPESLIGLPDDALMRLLGAPGFRRDDPPAQRWQYRTSACLFDVFLFQDTTRANAYAVTHIEARGLDVNRVSSRDCLLSVLKNRN